MKYSATIVIAAMNETFSLTDTVKIILDECDTSDLKEFVIVVCDRTTKECITAAEQAKDISEGKGVPLNIMYQTTPFAGGAYRDGFMAAAGTHCLMMSADLETDPHTVKELIAVSKKHPKDMVTASRWIGGAEFEGYNKLKYVLNWGFQKIFSVFYGVKLTDMTFGFRIMPTKLLQSINWEEQKHPFFLETALKPIKLGIKVHEIPSSWKAREEGESQNTLLQTFKYLRIAFKVKGEKREDILKK